MNYQVNNQAVVLKKRPVGELREGDLVGENRPLRAIRNGECVVRTLWLSLDPYMRPRMNDAKSYVEPVPLDGVMAGESVCRVVESRSEKYAVGDLLTCYGGWQEYAIVKDKHSDSHKIIDTEIPLQAYLGVAGMPGRTGYNGLMHIGKPQAGETVVISAASGPVGTVAGQTAKHLGCRVVGVAGGAAKCRYVVETLGFDACVDYKAGSLNADLREACPDGVDVYFENVGGDVTRAVAALFNKGARVPVCGYVSQYNSADMASAETPFDIFKTASEKPDGRFFVVTEWDAEFDQVTRLLVDRIKSGELKYRESVAEGLDEAVEAFKGMLKGRNFGKQLVYIAD